MGKSRRGALGHLEDFKQQIKDNEKFAGDAVMPEDKDVSGEQGRSSGSASEAVNPLETDFAHAGSEIPINRIVVRDGFNVRSEIPQDDEFEALVKGMAEVGLLQPIVVTPHGTRQYALIVGHRRLAAAKVLGWAAIPATIKDWDQDTQVRANYMENRHRASVSPYDDAKRAVDIMESKAWSLRRTAVYLGDSLGRLSGLVRIYRNPQLRLELEAGKIPLRWLNRLVVLLDHEGQDKIPGGVEAFLSWIARENPSEERFLEVLEETKAQGTLPGVGARGQAVPTPVFDRVWTSAQKLGQLTEKYERQLSRDELMAVAHSLITQGEQLAEAAQRRPVESPAAPPDPEASGDGVQR